jgi:hypothetical protein
MTHAVVDIERWLKGKAERVEGFAAFATDVTDYAATDGSNNVAITADIHDMAGAQAMMTSPRPRRRPRRSGTACFSQSRPTSSNSPAPPRASRERCQLSRKTG